MPTWLKNLFNIPVSTNQFWNLFNYKPCFDDKCTASWPFQKIFYHLFIPFAPALIRGSAGSTYINLLHPRDPTHKKKKICPILLSLKMSLRIVLNFSLSFFHNYMVENQIPTSSTMSKWRLLLRIYDDSWTERLIVNHGMTLTWQNEN